MNDLYAPLSRRVGELLHYVWDPIGVSGIAEARDEYDTYVPQVVQMLLGNKTEDEIARHLHYIQGDRMGLTVSQKPSEHTQEVAQMLVAHYEFLKEK
jgi:hypothetical protein